MVENNLIYQSPAALTARPRNPRTHSRKQLRQIADSIRQFGFTNPVLIDSGNVIIAGHGRVEAAKQLSMATIPTLCLRHLSAAEVRAYVIADNRLAELAGWDTELLALELGELIELDFDVRVTGFETAELDQLLRPHIADDEDLTEADLSPQVTSRLGDLWILGEHRLLCGDSLKDNSYVMVLDGMQAQLIFTDPPYNVSVNKHVSGSGLHAEFAMASGEMSEDQFTHFLTTLFRHTSTHSVDGSIHFVCMDWRHMLEILTAGQSWFELKNLCVWNKDNGGMGSLYRSKHELVFVFKRGSQPHINNIELGKHGRYRTNVWNYPGANSMGKGRAERLQMHPTVKPVALIADAIKDCSHRNHWVLDPFGGSGSTLIAAQTTGRRAALIELDPTYVDVTVRRYQRLTGNVARHAQSNLSFAEVAELRARETSVAIEGTSHV
jgi:DNA modification methylase